MDNQIGRSPSTERRRVPRRPAAAFSSRVSGRLRPGREVTVLDVGELGVLVEGPCRLRPGGTVSLNITLDGTERTIACHVAWCRVSAVAKDTGLRYQAGLAFDRRIGLFEPRFPDGYEIPNRVAGTGADQGSDYSRSERRR